MTEDLSIGYLSFLQGQDNDWHRMSRYLKLCIIIGSGHILISDTFNIAAVYAIMLLMWTMAIHSFQLSCTSDVMGA